MSRPWVQVPSPAHEQVRVCFFAQARDYQRLLETVAQHTGWRLSVEGEDKSL